MVHHPLIQTHRISGVRQVCPSRRLGQEQEAAVACQELGMVHLQCHTCHHGAKAHHVLSCRGMRSLRLSQVGFRNKLHLQNCSAAKRVQASSREKQLEKSRRAVALFVLYQVGALRMKVNAGRGSLR